MAIAGGNITLDSTEGMDKISQTEKVTSPYFSTGDTTLSNEDIITSSVADANEDYFFGISKTGTATTEEFNVAFGSTNGVGALTETGSKSETEAIYKQFASLLLAPTEVTGGFFISRNNSLAAVPVNANASGKDEEIYVMTARRSNMKDRINKGTWTVTFSGSAMSEAGGLSGSKLELTDDSANDSPTATPVGDRYNIISGTAGTISGSGASDRTYGFFYPDMGMLVFSATELSASIPGSGSKVNTAAAFDDPSFFGFGFPSEKQDLNTGLRLVNCLRNSGSISFRDEEDQISAQYFCRVRSGQMNFSNNPTFVSGSLNELRQTTMKGNPNTFISSVQLYNNAGEMVAVGNLSTPLKKNFSSEATIKVKLTY
jgi:hypothetical protein